MLIRGRTQPAGETGRARFKIRIAYVVLALIMAFFAVKFVQKAQEVRSLARQDAALRQANAQTRQDNAQLRRAIRYYRTPQYAENEARAVFGYTRPGDVAVQVTPRHPQAVAVRAAPVHLQPPPPVWKQWWQVFFG